MTDLEKAENHLDTGSFTCVVCRGDERFTATDRGVKPLLSWLDAGLELEGFSAADRVVGRATAFLYCLLGVKAVYAKVMSRPAVQVLTAQAIEASAETYVDGIINRRGDGPCPFEAAVLEISDPHEALAAIRKKMVEISR